MKWRKKVFLGSTLWEKILVYYTSFCLQSKGKIVLNCVLLY
jgi:hypothetical protein